MAFGGCVLYSSPRERAKFWEARMRHVIVETHVINSLFAEPERRVRFDDDITRDGA